MASEEEASLIIRLKDEASKGITSLRGTLDKFKAAWLGVTAAVAGAIAIGAKAIAAYAEEEKEINKLNQALKNQGITSQLASKQIREYASEIQKTTTFSDTAVIKQAALLTSFGLVGDKMKQAAAAARDLSIGMGIDLNTATLLLGKAFVGETGTLARYGVKIDETIPVAERFSAVLEQLNKRFGGQAEANLNTTEGRIIALKNAFNDLQEKIGSELLPVLQSWLGWMQKAIDIAERFTGAKNADLSVSELGIIKLQEERDMIIAVSTARGYLTEKEVARIAMITQQVDALTLQMEQEGLASQQELLNQEKKTAAEVTYNLAKEKTRANEKKSFEQWKKDMASESAYNKKINAEIVSDDIKKTEGEKKNRQEVMAAWSSSLNYISSLSTSKNKELAAIGKAAAIASATIDAIRAANLAMATIPPPFGQALAGLIYAAGMANVAKISGVQLAEGGIVMPRMGGVQATIAEAGQAEAVIPLGNERAKEQLQEAGIGGHTFNINVGTLVGSDGMREFAKVIDQELFSLRKNNESVALESI
jgi:hypothetical protein